MARWTASRTQLHGIVKRAVSDVPWASHTRARDRYHSASAVMPSHEISISHRPSEGWSISLIRRNWWRESKKDGMCAFARVPTLSQHDADKALNLFRSLLWVVGEIPAPPDDSCWPREQDLLRMSLPDFILLVESADTRAAVFGDTIVYSVWGVPAVYNATTKSGTQFGLSVAPLA